MKLEFFNMLWNTEKLQRTWEFVTSALKGHLLDNCKPINLALDMEKVKEILLLDCI